MNRSRCDEHGGGLLAARDVGRARPTGIVMVAPQTLLSNASIA
jgi:hypothetical protein